MRRRHRYLAHLPLTCEFSICELALQPPILSKETMDTFAGQRALHTSFMNRAVLFKYSELEAHLTFFYLLFLLLLLDDLEKRKRLRQKKARDEKRRERRIEMEENRKQGKCKYELPFF